MPRLSTSDTGEQYDDILKGLQAGSGGRVDNDVSVVILCRRLLIIYAFLILFSAILIYRSMVRPRFKSGMAWSRAPRASGKEKTG